MEPIILVGGGGHCISCIDVIEQEARFEIAGVVEGDGSHRAKSVMGYPVIGNDGDLPRLKLQYNYALVTVGQIKTADIRRKLYQKLRAYGFELPVIVSPKAYVSAHAKIGRGTIVMHHSLVNANTIIGDNCILNTKSLIEHDTVIGNHCHISTRATLNGNVDVGQASFIGSGTVVNQTVTIGKECIVGSGCLVKRNIPDFERIKR